MRNAEDEMIHAAGERLIARVNKRQQLSARHLHSVGRHLEERAVIKFPMGNLFLSRLCPVSQGLWTHDTARVCKRARRCNKVLRFTTIRGTASARLV